MYWGVSGDSGCRYPFEHIYAVLHRREDNSLDGASLRKYAFLARQDTLFVTIGANGLN